MRLRSALRIGMTAFVLVTAGVVAPAIEAYAQTQGMERRADRRGTRQTARQEGRAVKQECKAAGNSRASCRQEKRHTKQSIRQQGRANRNY